MLIRGRGDASISFLDHSKFPLKVVDFTSLESGTPLHESMVQDILGQAKRNFVKIIQSRHINDQESL